MPQSYGGLYEKIVNYSNFVEAYQNARGGKKNKPEVQRVHENWQDVILDIIDEINADIWRPAAFHGFWTRRERKLRYIEAPAFRDRIVHHAIVQVLMGIFERKMIYDSYSCRVGKGTYAAVERMHEFLVSARQEYPSVYVLKGDISKFFPSIVHSILLDILARTIREARPLQLIALAMKNPSNLTGCGLPIGALTSQLFSNVYMTGLDHYIKETLGFKYYIRYADDFVLIAPTKGKLWDALYVIERYAWSNLALELNPKTGIYPASHGVDFCGYRVFADKILPRKINIRNAKIRFEALSSLYARDRVDIDRVESSVASFFGYAKHCSSKRCVISALTRLHLSKGGNDNGEDYDFQTQWGGIIDGSALQPEWQEGFDFYRANHHE